MLLGKYVDVSIYFGRKKIRIAGVIAVLMILAVIACALVIIFIPGRGLVTVGQGRKLITDERYIIHAGGAVTDDQGSVLTYTNSREALENCYLQGNRIAEFDLMITADDEIVCAHDNEDESQKRWASEVDDAGWQNNPPTKETFLAARFAGELTTMSMDDLAQFMNDHGDFYVVTDVKDDNIRICRMIRERYPSLADNLIIQIYHEDEYDRVKELGFNYIIYTLYRATDEELEADALKSFADHHDLVAVTFWDEFTDRYSDSFEALKETGVPLCVHTVNDMDKMKYYTDIGVPGIYTDAVNKEEQYR